MRMTSTPNEPGSGERASADRTPQQQRDEERPAQERGEHADRQFGGGDDEAGQRVAGDQEQPAEEQRGGREEPVLRPDEQAADVRADHPDESDRSADRDDAA